MGVNDSTLALLTFGPGESLGGNGLSLALQDFMATPDLYPLGVSSILLVTTTTTTETSLGKQNLLG